MEHRWILASCCTLLDTLLKGDALKIICLGMENFIPMKGKPFCLCRKLLIVPYKVVVKSGRIRSVHMCRSY